MRIKQTQSITAFAKAKSAALKLPVLIVGDLNSSKWALPSNGPHDVLTAAGYYDPIGNTYSNYPPSGEATAEKTINANYDSYNGLKSDIAPSRTFGNGSHLDYIFTSKMRVGEWKMVLNNGGSGSTQVAAIPSDHNMITAKVELPDSASPLAIKGYQLKGSLGAATGPEVSTATGAYQQYERGIVLWSQKTGAHVSKGGIRNSYVKLGSENGKLGYPTRDEVGGLKDGGFYQTYQNGVLIWSPKTGAFMSVGAIRAAWGAQGYENGKLGYPTSNEGTGLKDGGVYQRYQNGVIMWSPKTGAHIVKGSIRTAWAAQGYENGKLGYPTSNEYASAGGVTQNYQGGKIVYKASTGARVVR
jgi:uncharacterized protein with LGFP repeats